LSANSWGTAQLLESLAADVSSSQLLESRQDKSLAIWMQGDGVEMNLWANQFDELTNLWGTAQLIDNSNGDVFEFQVLQDNPGNALLVWTQGSQEQKDLWVSRFDAVAGTWSTAQLVETEEGDISGVQLTQNNLGNAIIVWNQNDGTRNNVWAVRFE